MSNTKTASDVNLELSRRIATAFGSELMEMHSCRYDIRVDGISASLVFNQHAFTRSHSSNVALGLQISVQGAPLAGLRVTTFKVSHTATDKDIDAVVQKVRARVALIKEKSAAAHKASDEKDARRRALRSKAEGWNDTLTELGVLGRVRAEDGSVSFHLSPENAERLMAILAGTK